MAAETGSFTTLDEWLSWLETLSPREIVLGLERVAAVLDVLDLKRPARVINVAGTNGKGSSVAMLEALFVNAGYKTGSYTSPHVVRYNERIRVDRQPASDTDIIAAFERVQSARGDVPLTYFEFGTLAALAVFAKAGADTLILEVGMGGRLDAVNAVEPDACLITNIALDHTAWLGNDAESIAAEKAGIMRPTTPAVFGSADNARVIGEHASRIGADLRVAGEDFHYRLHDDAAGTWSWRGREHELVSLERPALAGTAQIGNAAAVLALIEAMGFDELLTVAQVNEAFGELRLDGRFQLIDAGRTWLLDVAHNPAAAAVLGESLSALPRAGGISAVIGVLADKDVRGIVEPLLPLVDSWTAVPMSGTRAEPAAALAQQIANLGNRPCRIAGTMAEALEFADRVADPRDMILVTGSFYAVGPALEWLRANRLS